MPPIRSTVRWDGEVFVKKEVLLSEYVNEAYANMRERVVSYFAICHINERHSPSTTTTIDHSITPP